MSVPKLELRQAGGRGRRAVATQVVSDAATYQWMHRAKRSLLRGNVVR